MQHSSITTLSAKGDSSCQSSKHSLPVPDNPK